MSVERGIKLFGRLGMTRRRLPFIGNYSDLRFGVAVKSIIMMVSLRVGRINAELFS